MVSDKSLSFPGDLLKPIYELYLDISTMYLGDLNPNNLRSQDSSNL